MDTYIMEMSILNDEYKLSMLSLEHEMFINSIGKNNILNEDKNSSNIITKIKNIVHEFAKKIKEFIYYLKEKIKEFFFKIFDKLNEKSKDESAKLQSEVFEDLSQEEIDEFFNSLTDKEIDEFLDEGYLIESYEDSPIFYSKENVRDYLNLKLKEVVSDFSYFERIYKLIIEHENLLAVTNTEVKHINEKDRNNDISFKNTQEFKLINDRFKKIKQNEDEIIDSIKKNYNSGINGNFDKSKELLKYRDNKRSNNNLSPDIKYTYLKKDDGPGMISQMETFCFRKDIADKTSQIREVYNNTMKYLNKIENFIDKYIDGFNKGIKYMENNNSYFSDAIKLYNENLNSFTHIQKCISDATKLIIEQSSNIFNSINKVISYNKRLIYVMNKNALRIANQYKRGEKITNKSFVYGANKIVDRK